MEEMQTALQFFCSEVIVMYIAIPAHGGGVAEWSNAHRWKRCVGKLTAGSNPVSSAMRREKAGIPSYLNKRVVFTTRFAYYIHI